MRFHKPVVFAASFTLLFGFVGLSTAQAREPVAKKKSSVVAYQPSSCPAGSSKPVST